MLEFHFRIWHKDIQSGEHQPCQDERNKPYHEFHDRSEQNEIIHLFENGAHKQGKSSGYHDQNRHQQEHGEIVRNLAIHGSCFFHFPDTVEGDFNITDQIDNRP